MGNKIGMVQCWETERKKRTNKNKIITHFD